MPIHDWTRLEAGDFHDFHQCWVVRIADALNNRLLPPGYMARIERVTSHAVPDDLAPQSDEPEGGLAVATTPPTARVIARAERALYAKRADRIVVYRGRKRVIAVVEILSPGSKASRGTFRSFIERATGLLYQGANLLVIDLFPPTRRDPHGIHKAIWDEFDEEPFEAPPGKPLIVASYLAGEISTAYVDSVGVGDPLPSPPIFLSDSETDYIPAPLEATYQEAWAGFPAMLKELLEP